MINDLIFKEFIKRGHKLEGKKRVWDIADSKLWYLTNEQAKGFLEFSKTEEYKEKIVDNEVSLIKKHMPDIIKSIPKKSCNIIDLGCGDGKKASLFIHELAKKIKIRYCPIDISSYMVSKAAETIRTLNIGEVLEFKWNVSDFENLTNITPLFREPSFENHFLILLGNTLGNFEKKDLLSSIANSMVGGDVLVIGNGISNSATEDLARPYNNELLDSFFNHIIRQIGLSKSDVSYSTRFRNSRVEMVYRLNSNKKVEHLDKTLDFKKGDLIIVGISFKYSSGVLSKNLQKFFSKVQVYTNEDLSYALAICKK